MSKKYVDFDNPPVVETLLSLQFENLSGLRTFHVGPLFEKYKETFPSIEEVEQIEPVFEDLDKRPKRNRVSFEFVQTPPFPRYWLKSKDEMQLLQVQQNRFIRNWKETGERKLGANYPDYSFRKDDFFKDLGVFLLFVNQNGIGEVIPNQCEITYINHITIDGVPDVHKNLSKILTVFEDKYTNSVLGDIEESALRLSYIFHYKDKPIGRLHISAEPRYLKNQEIYQVTLTARGYPCYEGIDGVMEFFDIARKFLTEGFKSITTPEMQAQWRVK